uniref:Uncharacterized protein n=1 Tax=Caenorhabditis japonica TaxID=281687 RepID=A0A8R1EP31_CAEJA
MKILVCDCLCEISASRLCDGLAQESVVKTSRNAFILRSRFILMEWTDESTNRRNTFGCNSQESNMYVFM